MSHCVEAGEAVRWVEQGFVDGDGAKWAAVGADVAQVRDETINTREPEVSERSR